MASSICSQPTGPFRVLLYCFLVPPPLFLVFCFSSPTHACLLQLSRPPSTPQAKSLIQKNTFPPTPRRFNLPPFRSCTFDTLHGPLLPFTLWYSVLDHCQSRSLSDISVTPFLPLCQPCLPYSLLITSLRPHETTLFCHSLIQRFSMNHSCACIPRCCRMAKNITCFCYYYNSRRSSNVST